MDSGRDLHKHINKLNQLLKDYKEIIDTRLDEANRILSQTIESDEINKQLFKRIRDEYYPTKRQVDASFNNLEKIKKRQPKNVNRMEATQGVKGKTNARKKTIVIPKFENSTEKNIIYLFLTDRYKIKLVYSEDGVKYSNLFSVKDFHEKFYQDYVNLEKMHDYIQWIFPSFRKSDFTTEAPPISKEEHRKLLESYDACYNFVVNYIIILDFYGLGLVSRTGDLTLLDNFQERFANLKKNTHNNLRISRILASLNIMGMNSFAQKLIETLRELIKTKTLYSKNILQSFNEFWIKEHKPNKSYYVESPQLSKVMAQLIP
jgi:hypothetical protein